MTATEQTQAYDTLKESYHRLQVRLDEQIQKNVDDKASYEKDRAGIAKPFQDTILDLEAEMAQLKKDHVLEMDTVKTLHAEAMAKVKADADFAVGQYSMAHDEMRRILAESPQQRAIRYQHATAMARLAAEQEAERKQAGLQ